jgi:phenylacetate-CoA ligase
MCSAEPLSDAKRAKLSRSWGARVRDTFGMTEAGMMGAEAVAGDGFHVWTDLYAIEVVDPETGALVPEGTVGSLVVTPLWTNTITPFLRWSSGDLVSYRTAGASDGPFSVFPVVKHAHRTTGFFKVRGINLNHAELEDFMFRNLAVADFKAELVSARDLDVLRLSVEVKRDAAPARVCDGLTTSVRDTFGLTPEVVVLDAGTLAREFEASVKTPRFIDRRQ